MSSAISIRRKIKIGKSTLSTPVRSVGNTTITATDVYTNTPLERFGKKTVLKFIQEDIKQNDNFERILMIEPDVEVEIVVGNDAGIEIKEDFSARGFFYERLWDLCVKFGVTTLTKPYKNGQLQTSHIINENTNTENDIQFQSNCWDGGKLTDYLEQSVRSGNAGGYSDITFINKVESDDDLPPGEELCFVSVKYFKEEKEIGKYDIGKLCALLRKHEKANREIKIYLFVNNKEKAIEKFKAQHKSSDILIKYINPHGEYENVYDSQDLHEAYFKLKKLLEQYNYLQTTNNQNLFEQNYLKMLKSIFVPRFHQKLFMGKINDLIEIGEKNILVGAIPRSGKSFIMAGTILDYVRTHNTGQKFKFLMMTPAPNETFNEYKDIFNKYIEFDQLGITHYLYDGKKKIDKICTEKDKHCVIIISKQKLGWSSDKKKTGVIGTITDTEHLEDEDVDEDAEPIEEELGEDEDYSGEGEAITENINPKNIKKRIVSLLGENPDINVMFLDEAHFGMSTPNAQQIVQILNSVVTNTVKIYVTATYNKPLQAYGVKPECKLTWDINDIKIMQTLNAETILNNLIEKRFGTKNYTEALTYFGDATGKTLVERFKKDYAVYPKPYLITSVWDKDFLNVEKLKIGDTEFGWDMNKLFAAKGGEFKNKEQVTEIMRYYFGYPNKEEGYDKQSFYRIRGILPRINRICANNCRTLQTKHKTTQLWFLPLNGGGKIKEKVKALINLLTNKNEFKDIKSSYHFFVAVDIEDKTKTGRTIDGVTYMGNPHNIKKDIENVESLLKKGKLLADNLIILAGNRLQLGISLRNVDIVTLWNSTSSTDAIFQMLFRSMTEVDSSPCNLNEYCAQKKFGFMVDMNPQRALTNVNLFTENMTKQKDKSDIQQQRQITDLINIDEDVYIDKYDNDEQGREMFVKELFNKLYTSWDVNVDNIKKIIGNFSFDMAKLEKLKEVFKKINIAKQTNKKETIQEADEDEFMPPGKKQERIGNVTNEKGKKKDIKEINAKEQATELIAEYISLLNIFTLYSDKGSKCILSDDKQANKQIAVIDDIDILKKEIFKIS